MSDLLAFVRARHPRGGVARVDVVDGDGGVVIVTVACSRPGLLIGKQGAAAEALEAALSAERGQSVMLRILELRRPELEPLLMVDHVIGLLSRADVDDADRVARGVVDAIVRAGAVAARVVVTGAYDVDVGDANDSAVARGEGERAGRCFDVSVTVQARTRTDR